MNNTPVRTQDLSTTQRNATMLVMTRHLNEAIKIGKDIEVIITSIHGNQVKVRF
jgi:hypothetical protein